MRHKRQIGSFLAVVFVLACPRYAFRIAKVDLPLRVSTVGRAAGALLEFAPFPASRKPDIWLRRRCENAFRPFQTSFSKEEAARITGRSCGVADVPSEPFSLTELESFCRE